tara:strand:- start:1061 stop:1396 length:336 start_codon:yes stop_codon:yes gene_type:complete
MSKKGIYKILFIQTGEIFEIYAKSIYQSDMYGFIEVEDYLFDQNSQIVVDPSEEKLKTEFKGVNRSYIPINAILRIDEVDKRGNAKITKNKNGNVMPLPTPIIDSSPKKDG